MRLEEGIEHLRKPQHEREYVRRVVALLETNVSSIRQKEEREAYLRNLREKKDKILSGLTS